MKIKCKICEVILPTMEDFLKHWIENHCKECKKRFRG